MVRTGGRHRPWGKEERTLRSSLSVALPAALLAGAAPALAQTASDARFATTTLDITGHGEARVPPDQATLELGVTTQGPSAAAAMQANAADMAKVVAALR